MKRRARLHVQAVERGPIVHVDEDLAAELEVDEAEEIVAAEVRVQEIELLGEEIVLGRAAGQLGQRRVVAHVGVEAHRRGQVDLVARQRPAEVVVRAEVEDVQPEVLVDAAAIDERVVGRAQLVRLADRLRVDLEVVGARACGQNKERGQDDEGGRTHRLPHFIGVIAPARGCRTRPCRAGRRRRRCRAATRAGDSARATRRRP